MLHNYRYYLHNFCTINTSPYKNFNASPINTATKMSRSSFTFFVFNKIIIIVTAITAVSISLIVRITITITEPAKSPATAAVIPFTNAFYLMFTVLKICRQCHVQRETSNLKMRNCISGFTLAFHNATILT